MYNRFKKKIFSLVLLLFTGIILNGLAYAQEAETTDSVLTVSDNVEISNDNKELETEPETFDEEYNITTVEEIIPIAEEIDETDAIFLDFQNKEKDKKVIISNIVSSEDIKKDFLSNTGKEYIKTSDNLEYKLNTNLSLKNSTVDRIQNTNQNSNNIKSYCEKEKNHEAKIHLSKTVAKKSVEFKFGVDNKIQIIP